MCALWELSYAQALILMHNIDVMYHERNVAESIVSTCMDIMGKIKDNFKARRDIAHVCNHPSLSSMRGEANLMLHFVGKLKTENK
jgi:hypothetical protein